jgi:hypothetical protein
MAFYQTETRIEGMDIEWVGFDPEKQEAYVTLRRTIDVADSMETVWVDHKITIPYNLLNAMAEEVTELRMQMEEDGITEFELRKPVLPVQ